MQGMKTMALVEKEALHKILPQKARMALIDRILSADSTERTVVSEAEITADNLFFNEKMQGVPSFVCFEMIAQTIAAGAALFAHGEGTKAGMVLSVNDFQATIPCFSAGDVLRIEVREDYAAEPIFRYAGTVRCGTDVVASAQITVAQADFEQKETIGDDRQSK